MNALLISLALFGQANTIVPPLPVASTPTQPSPAIAQAGIVVESVEELKAGLLARLIVDMSFDAQKYAETEKMIDTLNERQLRILAAVYKEQAAKRDQVLRAKQDATQQQALDQAKLDLQQAEAYRDHLKREYDRQILQGHMTQNLVYQNIVNNQRIMYQPYGGFGYGGIGYGGMGYGGMGYGGIGYGGMGYGGMGYGAPMMYGNPYYFGGRGF